MYKIEELKQIIKILEDRPTKAEVVTAIKQALGNVKSLRETIARELADELDRAEDTRVAFSEKVRAMLDEIEGKIESLGDDMRSLMESMHESMKDEIDRMATKEEFDGMESMLEDCHLQIQKASAILGTLATGEGITEKITRL
jgi:hypothetical protein